MITTEEAKFLFKAARSSLSGKKFTGDFPSILNEKAGVFVTIHTYPGHRLRGCIGIVEPVHALIKGVQEAAKSAAFDDYRFKPLTPEEFDEVVLEISILSRPLPCRLDDIKEGDGVILRKDGKEALFLPQVWEQMASKKEFLDQLCLKAGLSFDDWNGASFMKFHVIVFEETEPMGEIKKI